LTNAYAILLFFISAQKRVAQNKTKSGGAHRHLASDPVTVCVPKEMAHTINDLCDDESPRAQLLPETSFKL